MLCMYSYVNIKHVHSDTPATFDMQAYAKLRTDTPELLDLVAQFARQDLTDDPMAVDGFSSAPVANSSE